MSERNGEGLNERERACLAHVEEAARLGFSFSRYCREKDLKIHQWTWTKRALLRKGVISQRRRSKRSKAVGFVPVRIAPTATATVTTTVCRIRHPSGWTIECGSLPDTRWLSALLSGETA
jgi:hypothetical protein